jgi:hemerythrin-like domain-containing protein
MPMTLRIGRAPDHGFDEPLGLLSDCHRRIESFLRVLLMVAEQVNGAALSTAHRAQLEGALSYFATAALHHTADEEESLFPRLRASGDRAAHAALDLIGTLEQDHATTHEHHVAVEGLGRRWLATGRLTADDVQQLRSHLEVLETTYQRHIRVEDHELFPAAGRILSARQLDEIGREMAARRGVTRTAELR